jgi:large conductance mechanosensitive channel
VKGFRDFVLRGNVVDLAVAVVIGTAFTAIVTAIVTGLINPLIAVLFNASSLDQALVVAIPTLSGGSAKLLLGAVLGAIINFLIVAAVVYFVLVLPVSRLKRIAFERQKASEQATPVDTPPTETELLIQIRDLLAGRPSPEGDHALPAAAPQHRASSS